MRHGRDKSRKKRLIIFLAGFVSLACILILLYAVFWPAQNNHPENPSESDVFIESPTRYNALISIQDLLARRYDSITNLDEKYSIEVNNAGDETKLNEINEAINLEEELLRKSLDSINVIKPENADENYMQLYNGVIASYRSILKSRLPVSSLRAVIKLNRTITPTTDETELTDLQNELQEKDARIALLQTMLKTLDAKKSKKLTARPSANR